MSSGVLVIFDFSSFITVVFYLIELPDHSVHGFYSPSPIPFLCRERGSAGGSLPPSCWNRTKTRSLPTYFSFVSLLCCKDLIVM